MISVRGTLLINDTTASRFLAQVLRPVDTGQSTWGFVVLPFEASAKLPRRGRVTVEGTMNGVPFTALLEPDGKKSHWLKLPATLLQAAASTPGDTADFEVAAVACEPDPEVPEDFQRALRAQPQATVTWQATTPIARLDWVHWIVSAKQAKTRTKRIEDACSMLAAGKKRVCCFDSSGFYSKAFSAPQAAD